MIIGIDGCVATGKTTLARSLSDRLHSGLIPEYVRPAGTIVEPTAIQAHYFDEEALRGNVVCGDAVVDRTLLSQVAHAVAIEPCIPGSSAYLERRLRDRGERSWGVHPDRFVWLSDVPYRNQLRLRLRENSEFAEGTASLLGEESYMRTFDAVLRTIGARLPPDRFARMEACPNPRAGITKLRTRPVSKWAKGDTLRVVLDCLVSP